MNTSDIRKLPQWPKIDELIKSAMDDFKSLGAQKVDLHDDGSKFTIIVDGVPEFEIDASIIQ
jgi:hypothetical protein